MFKGHSGLNNLFLLCLMEFFRVISKNLWTPEIFNFMEGYCVVRKKPIRHDKTKLQTATVISLWFWGLLACPELYRVWSLHNQHSWNFSHRHGFLSLTVILSLLSMSLSQHNYIYIYITHKRWIALSSGQTSIKWSKQFWFSLYLSTG